MSRLIRGCTKCKGGRLFREKIGRCNQCMIQLTVLSFLSWGVWITFFKSDPRSINSVVTLFACTAFTGLLSVHLLAKWIVFPATAYRAKRKLDKVPNAKAQV